MIKNLKHHPQLIPICFFLGEVYFLYEFLTLPALLFAVLSILVSLTRWKYPVKLPTILGAIVFVWFVVLYRKVFDPEAGLNFLMSIISLKLLESKNLRDERIVFCGLLLLFGAATLFDRTFVHLGFTLLGIGFLFAHLAKRSDQADRVNMKKIIWWAIKGMPIALALFWVVPRFTSSLWVAPIGKPEQRVGFSEELKMDEITGLKSNPEEVFQVGIEKKLEREQLYWRGMTMSETDGWNWSPHSVDLSEIQVSQVHFSYKPKNDEVLQEIFFKRPTRRLFLLDFPQQVIIPKGELNTSPQGVYYLPTFQATSKARAYSTVGRKTTPILYGSETHLYLKENLSEKIKKVIGTLKGSTREKDLENLRSYFSHGDFGYTLAPGEIKTLDEFLILKKVGFCSHYASAFAQMARGLGIPARLVSGYLGGEYNSMGNHYRLTENDAHVWVEVYLNGVWQREDPTGLVVPARLNLSAQEFYKSMNPKSFLDQIPTPTWLTDTKLWVDNLNYKFLVWSESFDQKAQKDIAQKMNLSLQQFYSLTIWVILMGICAYFFQEFLKNEWWTRRSHPLRPVLKLWYRKAKKMGIDIEATDSSQNWRGKMAHICPEKKSDIDSFIDEWEKQVYQCMSYDETQIKSLLRSVKKL